MDQSLVMGRGGGYKMRRGASEFYLYKKGDGGKSLSHAEGRGGGG